MEANVEEHEGRTGPFRLDVCPECGGIWFDRGEISKLTNDRELERLIVDYAAGASAIPCPRCGGPMAKRPVAGAALDVCTACHGVWADRGELEAAMRALAPDVAVGPEVEVQGKDLFMSLVGRTQTRRELMSGRAGRQRHP